jgi:CheY-like chemotaxis protein
MISETVKRAMSEITKNGKATGLRNILVVDDHEFALSVIARSLSVYMKDVHILTAENGAEAVEILKSHPVASVLTDLNMPVMDGYELLRYLRENDPEMPVFALTSDLTPLLEETLRLMGVKQSFEKPFSIRLLGLKIADELEAEVRVCAVKKSAVIGTRGQERKPSPSDAESMRCRKPILRLERRRE